MYAKFHHNSPPSLAIFTFFQNLELGTASTDVKCHFAISWARLGNPSVQIMSIVMGMQNLIKIYQKVQVIGPVSLFSEFEPWKNLDLSQISFDISFDNLIGYILSISMCMQIFITIFLVNINVYAKAYQNIPLSSRDRAIFTFSEFGTRQSLER